MADTTEKPTDPASPYELAHEPDGTSFAVRANLVDILERELLGPIHGADELLPFSPRSQYLIGHIAPVRLTGAVQGSGEQEGAVERGDLVETRADEGAVSEVRARCSNGCRC